MLVHKSATVKSRIKYVTCSYLIPCIRYIFVQTELFTSILHLVHALPFHQQPRLLHRVAVAMEMESHPTLNANLETEILHY